MSLHYSAAWGQTLRSASLRRQKSKPFVQEPIPTFFHGREEPAFQTSNPEPVSQQHGIEQDLYAKSYAISSDSNFQKRFSKEFMRAITVQEREEIDTVPVVPRYRHAQMQEAGEYNSIVPNTQQGFILNMNKLSLISLIFGLLLLGLLFFVGGFMLAINFFGDEAPQSPPVHQQAHHGQNPLAGQLIQHTPVGKYAPIASDVARIVPAPAAAAPAPAAAAPAPAAAAPALAPVGAAKKADNYGYAASPQVLQASAQVSAQGGGAVIDASELTRPYALQVGIYTQRQGAQQIVNTLQRRGYHAYVVAVQMQGQDEVYAVRMGGYFTQAAASNAAQHLTQKERFKVMAVARNNAERVIF